MNAERGMQNGQAGGAWGVAWWGSFASSLSDSYPLFPLPPNLALSTPTLCASASPD
jgi:hypothetical protein